MRIIRKLQIALFALIALTARAQQQAPATGDPNNPNNPQAGVAASILDHGSGLDQFNQGPFVTATDKQFAQLLAMRSMLQIELGKMALQNGSSAHVKLVAQRMIDDYTKWQAGLGRVAPRLELDLPTELDKRRKAIVTRLSSLSGAEFDEAYIKEVIAMQNRALTVTQHEAANAGVTRFRNWAGLMMPTLLEHLKLTKQGWPQTAAK